MESLRQDAPSHHRHREDCSICGTTARDRQYHQAEGRLTCEHCLLETRKQLAGLLDSHPYEEFAESLAAALDLREKETGLHSKRVASHTLILARHHYADGATLREIYWGSLLHDIGKIGVPDAILLKPGRLSEEEWNVMRLHPEQGSQILEKVPFFSLAAQIVLCHEERYDGSGPLKKKRRRRVGWFFRNSIIRFQNRNIPSRCFCASIQSNQPISLSWQ